MSTTSITMAAPAAVYQRRRARLAQRLDRPFVIFAGHAPARSYATNAHRFRAACSYLYFGGVPLEHAALLIEPGSDGDQGCSLLRVPEGPDDALWLGETPSDADIAAAAGLAPTRIADVDRLTHLLCRRKAGGLIAPHVQTVEQARKAGIAEATDDEKRAVVEMRLVKDEHELAAMRRAAAAGVAAHRAARAVVAAGGATASDVSAAFHAELARRDCVPSFTTICTERGEVLHGACGGGRLKAAALLLLDAGAEEPAGYCSDITRTWPVGRPDGLTRALLETVVGAERAAVSACLAGARYGEIHQLAARHICVGLVDADLLRGKVDDLVARGAYTLFFPHGVGHLLGLGVHDLEEFGDLAGYPAGRKRPTRFGDCFLRLDRDLAPGMVVTIEPGIYLVPAIWRRDDLVAPLADAVNRAAVDRLLSARFGGIRIEDNVCVRAGEPEVLTNAPDIAPLESAA